MGANVIERKLRQVVNLERSAWLGKATTSLVAHLAILAACHFALDWGLRPQATGRLLMLAIFAAAAAYLVWKDVVEPLRKFPSHDEIALEIERFFPVLRGRFISAYQLSRSSGSGSPQLIARLLDEAASVARTLDFRSVPDRSGRNRAAAMASALLLGWVGFVLLTPTGRLCFPLWLQRLVNPFADVRYPTKTLVIVENGSRLVARGDDVHLSAKAAGVIPASGSIWIQRAGKKWVEQPVMGSGRNFTYTQRSAIESFAYYWRLGDGRSEVYRVTVVVPPQVRAIRVRYDYPLYTRRPPGRAFGGNLEGPPGTRATLLIGTNKPVSTGTVVLEDGSSIALVRQGPTSYSVALLIAQRSSYRIRLVDRHGFENRDPMEYVIEPLADQPPRVELRNVEEHKFVTPYARLPLEIHCRDDYGITAVTLHLATAEGAEKTLHVPVRPNRTELTVAYTVALEQLALEPGSEVLLWASAIDNRDVGERQQGISNKVRLEVVSPDDLIRVLRERMEALFPRLERMTEEALESRTSVVDVLRDSGLLDTLTTSPR